MQPKNLSLLLLFTALACAYTPSMQVSFVMDNTQVFTDSQISVLNELFLAHEHKTSNEIAVYTTGSYAPEENIHAYSTKLAEKSGIGKKDKNNGVLITLCVPCRAVDISTGKGTEKVLTDEIARQIIDSCMTPAFKKGACFAGILSGSKAIITLLEKPGNEIK